MKRKMNKTGMKTKTTLLLALFMISAIAVIQITPTKATTINYGNVSVSGVQSGHFNEVWDLTASDLVISFTYDANGMIDDYNGSAHAWAEFGVREVGYGDFNPTWMAEGAGVWLATDYDWTIDTFDPDPVGSPNLDLDDKLILQKGGGWDESQYNLPSTPPSPGANHRVWFDRDGVDQWQAQSPLAVDGGTYNTGGTYDIVITMHADSATSGTAYMTINGLDQGFETDGNWNTMELSPAGMTFTGDMANMQVFYGIWGYGPEGVVHSADFVGITVTGTVAPITATIDIDPDTLNLKSSGQWITAYIELPDGYDVADIVLETVYLDGIPAITDPSYGFVTDPDSYLLDLDGDGTPETRMVKFDRALVRDLLTGMVDCDTGTKYYDLLLTVIGELVDGTPFEGTDSIAVIKK